MARTRWCLALLCVALMVSAATMLRNYTHNTPFVQPWDQSSVDAYSFGRRFTDSTSRAQHYAKTYLGTELSITGTVESANVSDRSVLLRGGVLCVMGDGVRLPRDGAYVSVVGVYSGGDDFPVFSDCSWR